MRTSVATVANVGDARRVVPEAIGYNGGVRRHHAPPLALSLGAAAVLIGTFLPWWRSGTRGRSSYALLDLVDRLELASNAWATSAIRFWPVVPVLVVGSVVATWWGWHRVGAVCAVTSAVYASVLAIVIRQAPGTALVGTVVTIAGSLVLLASTIAVVLRSPA